MGAKLSTAPAAEEEQSWTFTVLEFCSWRDRMAVTSTSKGFHSITRHERFWKWFCGRLAIEHGIYCPTISNGHGSRRLFKELFALRDMWTPININEGDGGLPTNAIVDTAGDKDKIQVYARFRPKSKRPSESEGNEENENKTEENDIVEVTLPLHQRLAMIRMSHRLKSNREALQVLTSEGGWFQNRWMGIANSASNSNDDDNISGKSSNTSGKSTKMKGVAFITDEKYVLEDDGSAAASASASNKSDNNNCSDECTNNENIRGKLSGKTLLPKSFSVKSGKSAERITASVQQVDPGAGRVVMIAPDVGLREFSFDGVFPDRSTQAKVYDSVAKRLVMDFINGYNASAIVYGQTGSGKTYTMFGQDETAITEKVDAAKGIVPRACEEVLSAVKERYDSFGIESQIGVSYVEIYGDHVSDLLKYGARCGHSRVAAHRFVLSGAAEHPITSMEDVAEVLRIGAAQKRRAATAMNDRSSRAHSLFIVSLHQCCVRTGVKRTSRLFLADLGGSEQVKKSKVDEGATRLGAGEEFSLGFQLGERMREAVYINLGLLALKKVIEALNNQMPYTPYQDSKLTMLLSPGLGGDCKTAVIVCGSMDTRDVTETLAAMRFGEKCSKVELEARNNADFLAGVLANLDKQIAELEEQIREKERWVAREEVRKDELAEEGTFEKAAGGVEVKKVFYLTGAEQERRALEKLLLRRAEFTGQPLDMFVTAPPSDYDGDGTNAGASVAAGGSASASAATAGGGNKGTKKHKVVGFGRELAEVYGLGDKYTAEDELNTENTRFREKADEEELPEVVRRRFGGRQWRAGEELSVDPKKLEEKAKKVNRTKLTYAGLSF